MDVWYNNLPNTLQDIIQQFIVDVIDSQKHAPKVLQSLVESFFLPFFKVRIWFQIQW